MIAILAAAGLLAACAGGATGGGADGTGLCDFTVTEAEAWENRMPTVGERRRQLVVSVKVTPKDRIRRLSLVSVGGGVLSLDVAPGEKPLAPGVLSWRMDAPSEPVEQVHIACNGALVTTMDVGAVY